MAQAILKNTAGSMPAVAPGITPRRGALPERLSPARERRTEASFLGHRSADVFNIAPNRVVGEMMNEFAIAQAAHKAAPRSFTRCQCVNRRILP